MADVLAAFRWRDAVDILLVVVGPYEVSLVTVPGQQLSNMNPPSLLLAGHTIVLCAGAIALRGPGKLMWDAKAMRFTNSDEANKLLKPFLRKGWDLKV